MPISSEYAVLSKDKKTIILPDDVQPWLTGADRFVVVVENDELILKKTHVLKTLDEIVKRDASPLSSEDLDALIHESRK
jgi:hypothetical protein